MIEQLKTIREARNLLNSANLLSEIKAAVLLDEALTQLEAMVGEQEPVAWLVYTLDGKSVCVTDNPDDFTDQHRALPLYTAAPVAQQHVPEADCGNIKAQQPQARRPPFKEWTTDYVRDNLHKLKQPQAEAVPAWTTEQITAVARPIAMAIAENCRTAPQLVFPHLFLGLKDLLTSTAPHQAEAVPPGWKHVCYLWVDPETMNYEVDHCEHPPSELVPAYIKVAAIAQQEGGA